MSFTVNMLLFAVFSAAVAFTFGYAVQHWPRLYSSLPRERYIGAVLGIISLVWAAYHVAAMLEGGAARYRVLIIMSVPVVAVLCYIYLDYIFTRALGGVLLLIVNVLLQQGFVVHVPFRPFFSTILYLFGIAGLFLVASPWHLRDLLERSSEFPAWRYSLTILMSSLAIVFFLYALAA